MSKVKRACNENNQLQRKRNDTTLTDKENKSDEGQEVCYMCKRKFRLGKNDENEDGDENFKKYQKVKDHCHYTGKFRGAAHRICI